MEATGWRRRGICNDEKKTADRRLSGRAALVGKFSAITTAASNDADQPTDRLIGRQIFFLPYSPRCRFLSATGRSTEIFFAPTVPRDRDTTRAAAETLVAEKITGVVEAERRARGEYLLGAFLPASSGVCGPSGDRTNSDHSP